MTAKHSTPGSKQHQERKTMGTYEAIANDARLWSPCIVILLLVISVAGARATLQDVKVKDDRAGADASARIQPWQENPYYWQYDGEPVLLIGGSAHDNLFNHPDVGPDGLESHLDLLADCGGNYVRNTMSSRDEGNVWPFARDPDTGLYDLREMGDEYWERFERFLELTAEREIFVQIELFDRFDYAREPWQDNPFNPRNNVNYTSGESGLPEVVDSHPGRRENPFFRSVPKLQHNTVILPFQEAFVDKMLSISLQHGHVLYCISNETNESEHWGAYWANYIRDAADEAGVEVHVTEMWDAWDLSDPMHSRTFDHPELYTYVDISQNNHQTGQTHWNNAQEQRRRIADAPRPMNNVKMYGGTVHGGGYREGLRKLWRNVIGGMASARYHRPGEWTEDGPLYGPGLGEEARAYIRSARILMEDIGWPDIEPGLGFVERVRDRNGTVRTKKTHVAYTRSADGRARLYINGSEVSAAEVGGDLSSWDTGMRLALGDELVGERAWLGTYHEVAIYDRALEASRIEKHSRVGTPQRADGLQALYTFDEGDGRVVHDRSGREPALNLSIDDPGAVRWLEEGLQVDSPALIATEKPAQRLVEAVRDSGAFSLEAWVTPARRGQGGPARIVTLSVDHSNRNFTLGQAEDAYQVRFRTTETSANGLPGVESGPEEESSIAAARSPEGDRAVVFVSHGVPLDVDMDRLQDGLKAEWFNPRTAERQDASREDDGHYHPPSSRDWILVLQ